MSDPIKHECGIAMIRLLKPLRFYKEKYGTSLYGLNKLCLLMEKQHNRGQDGAGMANIKFDISPGNHSEIEHDDADQRYFPRCFGGDRPGRQAAGSPP